MEARSNDPSLLTKDVVGDVDELINEYPGVIVNAPKFDDDDALDAFESKIKILFYIRLFPFIAHEMKSKLKMWILPLPGDGAASDSRRLIVCCKVAPFVPL